jgi:thioester reductase-like protein
MVRLYGQHRDGQALELPPPRHAFWDWVQHLDLHRAALYGNADRWLAAEAPVPTPIDPDDLEGRGRTLWLGFSRHETQRLLRDLVDRMHAPFHHILLAGFATLLGRDEGARERVIDVESHGRISLDERIDVSRVVGWHTSTYPLRFETDGDIATTLAALLAAAQRVPDLGMAYGLREQQAGTVPARPSAAACFNYLGDFRFAHDERFPLALSRYDIGRARGERNHRGHALKLTARVVEGHLVVDLSIAGTANGDRMSTLLRELKGGLLGLLGDSAGTTTIVAEPGTRSGLIGYVPRQLALEPAEDAPARRDYRRVLLTGATGFVGVHVLQALLEQSAAHVVCLVRRRDGRTAEARLREVFDDHFPEAGLSRHEGRWSVQAGDAAAPNFGLDAVAFEQLAVSIDAIYHLAADTRLFGPEEDFRRHNVLPVQACIALAQHKRPKDLHHVSTLAVCGVNAKAEPVVFSEDSADIGQEFQNHYESTKALAEGLVRQFDAAGSRGFIYRLGNVSGHSRTGRFQRNTKDNRLVQFLAACAKLGRLPRSLGEPVVLSPVDQVAAGLVAISLDGRSGGGTYHVDAAEATSMQALFDALGIAFERTDHADFLALFNASRCTRDAELALGHFWAARRPRNVRFNHERTLRTLQRLGHAFTPTDGAWLARFVRSLMQAGAIPTPPVADSPAPTPSHSRRSPMQTLNPSFVLKSDDIAHYRDTGFVRLKQFFADGYIAYLREKVRAELKVPTDRYQKGFDKLGYDLCEGDPGVYALLENPHFREIMKALTGKKLFFTQGVGFELKKNVSRGFAWHIESQSFGFHRTEDYATTLWAPLDPVDTRGQRGGMRYVPTNIISGEYMYSHVDPAVFRCIQERIDAGGIAFEDYVALRDGPLNSDGMCRLLEFFAVEDDFATGDVLLFDKFVMHKSVKLEDGPMESRDAFSFRFIDEDSRYDHHRAHMIEIPRDYFKYPGPTRFHLEICKQDGERIVDSPFFHDRERRRLSA